MTTLGGLVRKKIRVAPHHGVKRAMAVIWSGFEYDMGLVVDGFTSDLDKTKEENEVVCLGLIEAAEEPGVDLCCCLKTRCFLPLMTRACEPNLGMEARVIELVIICDLYCRGPWGL
jgi:hypothetical protein